MENQQSATAQIQEEAAQPVQEANTEQIVPEICRYKVLFGKSEKPLYFEHEDGRCFDCETEDWLNKKPNVARELNSRPITTTDFLFAILHGLVDQEAYDTLDEKKLVTEEAKRAFEALKKINDKLAHHASYLAKSEESLDIPDDYFDAPLEEGDEPGSKSMQDLIDHLENGGSEGLQSVIDYLKTNELSEGSQGTDVVAEVMALAHKLSVEPNLEAIIRQIVREEMGTGSTPEVIQDDNEPI